MVWRVTIGKFEGYELKFRMLDNVGNGAIITAKAKLFKQAYIFV